MTFKELYLSGQIEFDEIDRYISRWNRSDDERTLAKYLGLNAEEEDVWIDDSDEALQDLLDSDANPKRLLNTEKEQRVEE